MFEFLKKSKKDIFLRFRTFLENIELAMRFHFNDIYLTSL